MPQNPAGETNLSVLLTTMQPTLQAGEYVFCSVAPGFSQTEPYAKLTPIGLFREAEGLTLILERTEAEAAALLYSAVFRMITLSVHSSLEAVGFLAAITGKLAEQGISVNPVSAYYHDHLFVPAARASQVMDLLQTFANPI